MHEVSDWITDDQVTLVHFRPAVLQVFSDFAQVKAGSPESGGLLLGSEHGGNFDIVEATKPTKRDVRNLFSFTRNVYGHRDKAKKLWQQSQGTVGYLGEWHTHPEDYPTPSEKDRFEWQKLVNKREVGNPLIVVIIGRKGIYIELLQAPNRRGEVSSGNRLLPTNDRIDRN